MKKIFLCLSCLLILLGVSCTENTYITNCPEENGLHLEVYYAWYYQNEMLLRWNRLNDAQYVYVPLIENVCGDTYYWGWITVDSTGNLRTLPNDCTSLKINNVPDDVLIRCVIVSGRFDSTNFELLDMISSNVVLYQE